MQYTQIAQHLGVSSRTVRRWLSTGTLPYSGPRKQRPRLVDPYKPYLLKRSLQGCRKGAQLEREVRTQGYKGSGRALYRYLETLEPTRVSDGKRGSPSTDSQPNPLLALSANHATWLFFRRPEDLNVEEQETLRQVRQAGAELEITYQLVEGFLHLVRERKGEQLDDWLQAVQDSHLQAFQPFVTGIQKDKEAVLAGLTLAWSNGPLEEHVNRLKLIKRSMYGRAEFDLLKLRVLHQSRKSQDRKNKQNQTQQGSRLKNPKSIKEDTTSQHTIIGISKVAYVPYLGQN